MNDPTNLDIKTARVFKPLLQRSRYKGAYGGRGSAKSHFFGESIIELCVQYPGSRVVCVREIQRSLNESVKRLLEDKIEAFGLSNQFRVLTDRIIAPGNGVVLFQGMQDHTKESIKSLEGFNVAYVEEAQTMTKGSLEMLRPTIRGTAIKEGEEEQRGIYEIWFSWNPRNASDPVDAFLRGPVPAPDSVVVQTNWRDNPFFPPELKLEREFDEQHRPERYGHVWEGQYEPTAIGALWTRGIIHRNRIKEAPQMGRIIIGVDPPISNEEGSDECGIVAVGLGEDGRGYVLGDYSRKGSPQEWAETAVAAYNLHEADCVVAETNQGGDMVEHTIRTYAPNISVRKVWATRGKHIRAEPISSLYALDKISHVGAYPELEDQMCLMTVREWEGEGSPDRLCATVWGFYHLFPKLTKRGQDKNQARPKRANNAYNVHRPHAR